MWRPGTGKQRFNGTLRTTALVVPVKAPKPYIRQVDVELRSIMTTTGQAEPNGVTEHTVAYTVNGQQIKRSIGKNTGPDDPALIAEWLNRDSAAIAWSALAHGLKNPLSGGLPGLGAR